MADYVAYLTNCITTGDEFSEVDGEKLRNLTRFSLEGFNIELIQRPEIVKLHGLQEVIGRQLETSQLIFRDVSEAEFGSIRGVADVLCELLSFALESRVGVCGYDFPTVGAIQQRAATVGTIETFRPPFFYKNGSQVKNFIELCYDNYRAVRASRTLHIAVDYLHQAAMHGLAVEVKLAVLFVLLEHLKHTYALAHGHPFIQGFFREIGATPAAKGDPVSFRRLLTDMLAAQHMTAALKPLIDLRNELIHSGLSVLNAHQKWQKVEEVETLIREYLLRLLGYTGEFFPYDASGSRTI